MILTILSYDTTFIVLQSITDEFQLWPTWKREAAFAFLFFNCIIFAACPGPMIAPATVALAIQLNVPIKSIAQLSGYQLLIVGALG